MKPKRIYRVYMERSALDITSFTSNGREEVPAVWRWRCLSAHNGKIVSSSGEDFYSKGNAMRAARREVSLYPEGVAVVEVAS